MRVGVFLMRDVLLVLDENAVYPFLLRRQEKCTGFLRHLVALEGGVLKCYAGKLIAIGIQFAQEISVGQTIEITDKTPGVSHQIIDGSKLAGLEVVTPYAWGSATDEAVVTPIRECITDVPAFDEYSSGALGAWVFAVSEPPGGGADALHRL